MTADARRKLCKYCYFEQPEDGHMQLCPRSEPEGPARERKLREWERGYKLGYNDSYDENDNYIPSWQVNEYYSKVFRLGYDVGRDQCQEEVDRAFQSNYGIEVSDDDDIYDLV